MLKTAKIVQLREVLHKRVLFNLPWAMILLFTSCFQFFRGAWIDGSLFLIAGIALFIDAFTQRSLPRLAVPKISNKIIVSIVAALAILMIWSRNTLVVGVIIVALGAIALPFVWSGYRAEKKNTEPQTEKVLFRAALLWSILIVLFCIWELAAFFVGDSSTAASYAHPALTDIILPLLNNVWGYSVCVVLWLVAGVALLRRGRAS